MDDEFLALVFWLVFIALVVAAFALPIIALVVSIRTRIKLKQITAQRDSSATGTEAPQKALLDHMQELTWRIARLEAAMAEQTGRSATAEEPFKREPEQRPPSAPSLAGTPILPPNVAQTLPAAPPPIATPHTDAERIESIIGRRWLGWAAVALIVFATAFFLKYAFDNRWIGELGRVAIGVAAGITLTMLGYRYHKQKWRVFSQILTGGGIVVLYLSAYASFGFYHLAPQQAAFAYMTILIVEAAGLALLYNAPAIAVMALLGGFLTPILLHSDRDQYRALFGYLFALDLATLAFFKQWWGLSSVAFASTHLLFWLWYIDNYQAPKRGAVMTFQTAIFVVFLLGEIGRRFFNKKQIEFDDTAFVSDPFKFMTSFETFSLLLVNPFVFFATAYYLLNEDYHRWMGAFAVGLAVVYAGAAGFLLKRKSTTRTEFVLMVGIALAFVTLAIPIQFEANLVTISWAVEALLILWVGIQTRSALLRSVTHGVFTLALMRLVFRDTPFDHRPMFTPVLNKYFLSSLFVAGCLFAGALLYEKLGKQKETAARTFQLILLIVAILTLWFIMTVEAHTFFAARADSLVVSDEIQHQRWLGQMALSVLWSVYAAVLMAVGFFRRAPAIRWVALSLFALTVVKVMLIDIAILQQLYRIIAFLVLGLLLLTVAWGYHKVFHSQESST